MKKMYSKLLFLITCVFCCHNIYAQLEAFEIDGEGWAKGDFVEIGINEKGSFGAKTINKPASFHLNREADGNNIFGFIANPQMDGWVDYDGDFFTPGEPEEGFGIEINGANFNNNNSGGNFQISGGIKGVTVISSDCFDDVAQITWEGNVLGVNVKRHYSVTKDGLFIQMTTILKNLSTEIKQDVYFMQNVDPDNDVTLSGSYETDMEIVAQASSPTDDISLVKASKPPLMTPLDMDGSYVSLYGKGENVRVTYGGFNNRSASTIWNATGGLVGTEGSSTPSVDEAISLAINIGDIEVNETVKFTYYYILEEVDDTFTPFIVNVFEENPTTCNGNDGKIIISGLNEGDTYTVNYVDDGVFVPNEDYTADSNGDIEIINLNSGTYSNLNISFLGCSTSVNTNFELTDPIAPNYTVSKEDFTVCNGNNGSLIFSNLTPFTEYSCQFTFNGVLFGPDDYVANASGNIVIENLERGIYTNFILEQYLCETPSNEIVEIFGPANPTIPNILTQYYCDEDHDYITTIDLSPIDIVALDGSSDILYNITYHNTDQDALDNVNSVSKDYTTSGDQSFILYVRKEEISTGCFIYTSFEIVINIPADFELEDKFICLNSDNTVNLDYTLPVLSTGLSNSLYQFEWFLEGALLPSELSNNLIASIDGEYTVNVTTIDTGCSIAKTATIIPSGPPQSLEVIITSPPFSENHTVEITAIGYGNYLYQMDYGIVTSNSVFTNINPGYHEFNVIDTNGCGVVTVNKIIIDYMPYFTPNNDGINDYWQIIGISELIDVEVFIFDRYGKLLTTLNNTSKGWDGTYNNSNMPTNGYWFKIIFKDTNLIQREFKSHFTLKR